MVRQISLVEVNQFNAGLITDRSPLTAQENSSLEEENYVLNIDGSRNRRLGLDFEPDYTELITSITNASTVDIAISNFNWGNAGGDADKDILVVQTGSILQFFDLDIAPLSLDGLMYTYDTSSNAQQVFSYAVVDGVLIVATGIEVITLFTFTAPGTVTVTSDRLLIRDMFGLEDFIGAEGDHTVGSLVSTRPATTTSNHTYNLRNQGWGVPRIINNTESLGEPIANFILVDGLYPANSDRVVEALYPDAEDTDNRLVDRFFPADLYNNPLGTSRAPMGYFIIDAINRGISRNEQYDLNMDRYPTGLTLTIGTLNEDITPGGATVVTEFAGRAWYAGFSGELVDGDSKSPRMSSYILFSKVVDSVADITQCYQEGDPTSKNAPDIIDTDGGFIRINEAYGIVNMVNLGSFLLVIANNGVWRITGGTDNGFTATSYIVEKLTDRGCNSPKSITVMDNTVMYWGDDGIYHIHPDQFGGYVAQNISFGKIQRLFDTIGVDDRRKCQGAYDNYERKVRWIYQNRTVEDNITYELVLDVNLQAFYLNSIKQFIGNIPRVLTFYKTNPYEIDTYGVPRRELGYIVATRITPYLSYSFATYRNLEFRDWYSLNESGVDAEAFMVTSYLSGNDFQRDKQVPYLSAHFRRTETGFELDGDDIIPTNPSSCLIQARWDWSDSSNGGKWGREFQAYRYKRLYFPTDVNDPFDNGFSTIVTKNKMRGNGRVLSIRWRTEPYKDCHLFGWSMSFSVAEQV